MSGPETFSELSRTILVDGQFRRSTSTEGRDVVDPATEEVLTELAETSPDEIDHAVACGHAAQKTWWAMSGLERAEAMHEVANELLRIRQPLAEALTREMGKPYKVTRSFGCRSTKHVVGRSGFLVLVETGSLGFGRLCRCFMGRVDLAFATVDLPHLAILERAISPGWIGGCLDRSIGWVFAEGRHAAHRQREHCQGEGCHQRDENAHASILDPTAGSRQRSRATRACQV